MSKAKTLATTVSTGNVLADGTVAYAEVSGTPTLATVATSGAYADVSGTPTLATVATSGSYTDLTDKPTISATATNIAGGSAGTIPYQSAADTTAMLAVGTAGQVLQTNGAGAPTWVTPAGGAWNFLGTVAASGYVADLTGIISSTYEQYVVLFEDVNISTAQLYMQFFVGGTLHTGNNYNASSVYRDSTGSDVNRSESGSKFRLSNAANLNQSGTIYISSGQTGGEPSTRYHISSGGTVVTEWIGAGVLNVTGSITGVRFFPNGATFTSGRFRIYGIVKA